MANKKKQDDPCTGCNKDKKHCKSCEHGKARAMALADAERLTRLARTEMISGEAPYDRNLYIQQAKFYTRRSIEDILMAGKYLLILQEKEGYGEFVKLVEEEIGMPHTTAYRYMNAAIKAEAYPRIDFSHAGRIGHVYALLEAPEEDLKELESKGVLAGMTIDELNKLSVKEMKDLIRQLKADGMSLAKGVLQEKDHEIKALNKEVKRLRKFDVADVDERAIAILTEVDAQLEQVDTLLRQFVYREEELSDDTFGKVRGIMQRINDRVRLFDRNLSEGYEEKAE